MTVEELYERIKNHDYGDIDRKLREEYVMRNLDIAGLIVSAKSNEDFKRLDFKHLMEFNNSFGDLIKRLDLNIEGVRSYSILIDNPNDSFSY